jgi:hypothetical protein
MNQGSMTTARQLLAQELDAQIELAERLAADVLAVELKLPEWGYYARCHDLGLGYGKPVTSQFRAKGWDATDLRARIPRISDDEAMQIDTAVASLDDGYKEAIVAVYRDLVSYRSLPRHLQRARDIGLGMLAVKLEKA